MTKAIKPLHDEIKVHVYIILWANRRVVSVLMIRDRINGYLAGLFVYSFRCSVNVRLSVPELSWKLIVLFNWCIKLDLLLYIA